MVAFRPLPSPEVASLDESLAAIASHIAQTLELIDATIEQHALGLRLLQHPMPGKLDIRWWKLRGDGDRTPIFVKWDQDNRRPGKLQPRVIKQFQKKVVRSTGLFELNYKPVLELAIALDLMMKNRASLKSLVRYKILPTAAQAQRMTRSTKWLRTEGTKAIAQGLCELNLDGYGWSIPENYKARIDYEQVKKLADEFEHKRLFID